MSVKIESLNFGFSNCYVLTGKDGSILVDTGMPKSKTQLLEKIRDKNVRLILLTHGHLDHVSNAHYISKQLNIPIAMSEEDYPLIKGAKMEINTDVFVAKVIKPFFMFMAICNKSDGFTPIFIKEGDSLVTYGVDAKIIALSGHSKGSVGVLTVDNDLISGDATTNIFYVDRKKMLESANKILSMGIRHIYPGHGEIQTPADVAKEFHLK